MNKDIIRNIEWLQIIIIAFLFLVKLIPQFQYKFTGITWGIIYHIIFIIWFVISINYSGLWYKNINGYLSYVCLWLLVLFFEFIIFKNTQLGYFSLNLTFWEPIIIYYYYSEVNKNSKISKIISILSILFILYGLILSIRIVNVNELAAREASSGHNSDDSILAGNYSFTAMLTILVPIWIGIFIIKQKIIIKILSLSILILSIYFIIHCNLLISIVCLFISMFSLFLFNEGEKININKSILIFTSIIVIIITGIFWKDLLIYLLDKLDSLINTNVLSQRIYQLKVFLNGVMIGNVESRFNLDIIALRTFINNPIFGIGPQNKADIYYKTQLGLHATLFDDMARYGLLGIYFQYKIFKLFIRQKIIELRKSTGSKVIKSCFFIYIIISMLNPTLSANIGITIFFIVPMLSEYIFESNNL